MVLICLLQIACTSQRYEANPKVLQTHTTSAPMTNSSMKSEFYYIYYIIRMHINSNCYIVTHLMTSRILLSSFYADFGPLNLGVLYRYCCKLNKKLKVGTSVVCSIKCVQCSILHTAHSSMCSIVCGMYAV